MSNIHSPVFYTIVENRYYLPCKKEINFLFVQLLLYLHFLLVHAWRRGSFTVACTFHFYTIGISFVSIYYRCLWQYVTKETCFRHAIKEELSGSPDQVSTFLSSQDCQAEYLQCSVLLSTTLYTTETTSRTPEQQLD